MDLTTRIQLLFALGFCCYYASRSPVDAVKPHYKHFDEYLDSLGRKIQHSMLNEDEQSSKEDNTTTLTNGTTSSDNKTISTTTSSTATTTVLPIAIRQNVSCCMLGELAGDKGFHCYVDYYVARIMMRNKNRAHNRKTGLYGRYRVPGYGDRLMKTFEQCVAGQGSVFHRCCHLATLERRERDYHHHHHRRNRAHNNRSPKPRQNHHHSRGGGRKAASEESREEDDPTTLL